MRVLVTGAAGFIGAHACRALLARGDAVAGIDSFSDYYDPRLKHDRVAALCPGLELVAADVNDEAALEALFARVRPEAVLHLAAQAGVRYSLEQPQAYARANVAGSIAVFEACRRHRVRHVVYASSSSVYGGGAKPPFSEDQRTDRPLSVYAATKVATETLAHGYAHLYRIPFTGLRFFTVYGPWGRPDMAPVLFARAALAGRAVRVFNHGRMRRDFTHVDDIVAGVLGALGAPLPADAAEAPHRVFNLGNHAPVELEHFLGVIQRAAGRRIERIDEPLQPGDMVETMADTRAAEAAFGFRPTVRIEDGLPPVVAWCRDYFGSD